jgi:3-oxoacyl-[acyl-carrier protein] reductase
MLGKVVNISSVIGIKGNIGQSVYSASKAGVLGGCLNNICVKLNVFQGFTKSCSKEFGSRGIQVNAIAPGKDSFALSN